MLSKNTKSRIAYATDTWTTKQMVYTFSCTAAFYISDDWELVEHVVDFKPLEAKEHEGIHAGYAFFAGARQRGGLSKISGIIIIIYVSYLPGMVYFISLTTDNASVNDVIMETVSDLLLTHYGIPKTSDMHVRCFAHVINLVVQAFLSALDEVESPDQEDYYILNQEHPIHYDVGMDVSYLGPRTLSGPIRIRALPGLYTDTSLSVRQRIFAKSLFYSFTI